MMLTSITVAAASTAAGLTAITVGPILLLRRISNSVGLAPPTSAMIIENEEHSKEQNCALFRHLPHLTTQLAWRSLGAVSKTPVHICRVPIADTTSSTTNNNKEPVLEFCVKREDLISPLYGGNKVRTLQHQLAVCESRRDNQEPAFRQLVSLGTGGSNQVVAMVVHAQRLGWDGGTTIDEKRNAVASNSKEPATAATPTPARINVCWADKDEPDLDNTLNMLSVLSFPNVGFQFDWGQLKITTIVRALIGAWKQKDYIPMMLGGNCPSGVLGQVSGVLELAEQIMAGESSDPSRIYVPIGSGCTISGLIVGTVLVRHLGLNTSTGTACCLSDPDFRIVGCNVQHQISFLDRALNFHVNPLFGFMPLTITHTVKEACRALKQLGGPDIESEAMEFIKTSVEIRSDAAVVGRYGGHSEKSRAAAKLYDARGVVTDYVTGQEKEKLWLCGHFAAKAFQPLLSDLREAEVVEDHDGKGFKSYMFWMTKSAVQPRGNVNEWNKMMQANDVVKEWADKGKAESIHRPGRVSTVDGKPDDYRSIMTKIVNDE